MQQRFSYQPAHLLTAAESQVQLGVGWAYGRVTTSTATQSKVTVPCSYSFSAFSHRLEAFVSVCEPSLKRGMLGGLWLENIFHYFALGVLTKVFYHTHSRHFSVSAGT